MRDKIEGGWAGQIIGVSFGAPTEFRSNGKINEAELPPWTPDRVSNAIHQDDLYVDMTFAKVLDDKGLDASVGGFRGHVQGLKIQPLACKPGRPPGAETRDPGRGFRDSPV